MSNKLLKSAYWILFRWLFKPSSLDVCYGFTIQIHWFQFFCRVNSNKKPNWKSLFVQLTLFKYCCRSGWCVLVVLVGKRCDCVWPPVINQRSKKSPKGLRAHVSSSKRDLMERWAMSEKHGFRDLSRVQQIHSRPLNMVGHRVKQKRWFSLAFENGPDTDHHHYHHRHQEHPSWFPTHSWCCHASNTNLVHGSASFLNNSRRDASFFYIYILSPLGSKRTPFRVFGSWFTRSIAPSHPRKRSPVECGITSPIFTPPHLTLMRMPKHATL